MTTEELTKYCGEPTDIIGDKIKELYADMGILQAEVHKRWDAELCRTSPSYASQKREREKIHQVLLKMFARRIASEGRGSR